MADKQTRVFEKNSPDSTYAGRWVARLRGRIIAQGGTPELASRAAKSVRHKEKPEIAYMPAPLTIPALVEKVRQALPANQEIYLVGGAVRDLLLQRVPPDLDFAVPANGINLARRLANTFKSDFVVLDEEREMARLIVTNPDGSRTYLDFAAYRPYPGGGKTPDINSDLHARDFTVNALAFDLHSESILDPLEGAVDLRAKRIRACSPGALLDDPVRTLRAIRMAAALDFQIEKETRKFIKEAAGQIVRTSPERLRDELFKILEGPKPDAAIRALEMLDVLGHVLPELTLLKGVEQSSPHVHEVWTHTLAVLHHLEGVLAAMRVGYDANQTNDLFTGLLTLQLGRYREQLAAHFEESINPERSIRALLFFAALYHDVAKPQTRKTEEGGRIRFLGHDEEGAAITVQRGEALRLSNDELERLRLIVAQHMRFHNHVSRMEGENKGPSRRAIYRFYRDSGEAGIDLILLGLADIRATRAHTLTQATWTAALAVARTLLENFWEKPQEIISPPRLLDGHELMRELSLQPGPQLGQLLEEIREAQAMGNISTREEALLFAREWSSSKR